MDYSESELQAMENAFGKDFDPIFLEFEERITRAPDQIIRYAECILDSQSSSTNEEDSKQSELNTKQVSNRSCMFCTLKRFISK